MDKGGNGDIEVVPTKTTYILQLERDEPEVVLKKSGAELVAGLDAAEGLSAVFESDEFDIIYDATTRAFGLSVKSSKMLTEYELDQDEAELTVTKARHQFTSCRGYREHQQYLDFFAYMQGNGIPAYNIYAPSQAEDVFQAAPDSIAEALDMVDAAEKVQADILRRRAFLPGPFYHEVYLKTKDYQWTREWKPSSHQTVKTAINLIFGPREAVGPAQLASKYLPTQRVCEITPVEFDAETNSITFEVRGAIDDENQLANLSEPRKRLLAVSGVRITPDGVYLRARVRFAQGVWTIVEITRIIGAEARPVLRSVPVTKNAQLWDYIQQQLRSPEISGLTAREAAQRLMDDDYIRQHCGDDGNHTTIDKAMVKWMRRDLGLQQPADEAHSVLNDRASRTRVMRCLRQEMETVEAVTTERLIEDLNRRMRRRQEELGYRVLKPPDIATLRYKLRIQDRRRLLEAVSQAVEDINERPLPEDSGQLHEALAVFELRRRSAITTGDIKECLLPARRILQDGREDILAVMNDPEQQARIDYVLRKRGQNARPIRNLRTQSENVEALGVYIVRLDNLISSHSGDPVQPISLPGALVCAGLTLLVFLFFIAPLGIHILNLLFGVIMAKVAVDCAILASAVLIRGPPIESADASPRLIQPFREAENIEDGLAQARDHRLYLNQSFLSRFSPFFQWLIYLFIIYPHEIIHIKGILQVSNPENSRLIGLINEIPAYLIGGLAPFAGLIGAIKALLSLKDISECLEKSPLALVFTVAIINAIGCVAIKSAAGLTDPFQLTFWVYTADLFWAIILMLFLGKYKASSAGPGSVYRETFGVWRGLKPLHKLYIALFTLIAVVASCVFYCVLPHVSSAMILVFMQMNLVTALPLSFIFLNEKNGWGRKGLGIGVIALSIIFMLFTEWLVNPAFLASLQWVGLGILAGALWGVPGFFIRLLFKEIKPVEPGREPAYADRSDKVLSFLPMVIVAFNYLIGTPALFIISKSMGISLFSFEGIPVFHPVIVSAVVISAFFFVGTFLLSWKLSRMVDYDLSKIAPGVSSTSMFATLMSAACGQRPFASPWSLFATLGVILGSCIAASGKKSGLPSVSPEAPADEDWQVLNREAGRMISLLRQIHSAKEFFTPELYQLMERIARKALLTGVLMTHHENRGGHPAAIASSIHIMAAIYFTRALDFLLYANGEKNELTWQSEAQKPHAVPGWYGLLYEEGMLLLDQLENFRTLKGLNAYPTHEDPGINIPAGSLGLAPGAACGRA
ncbi:MAG: hypothetical protein WC658_04055, partial [Candidatus Omnitrophota bacterium]